ncbi:unnamed protein product [Pedinophyceae sp. YPF-701]|nr:unnamed protein product [Pedinophyceae sp. YPF-701]
MGNGNSRETALSKHIQIRPHFTVKDKAAFLEIVNDFLAASKGEQKNGCYMYNFYMSEDGTLATLTEVYADGEALLAHMGNVGGILPKVASGDVSELSLLEICGPEEEIAKVKGAMPPNTRFMVSCGGLACYRYN